MSRFIFSNFVLVSAVVIACTSNKKTVASPAPQTPAVVVADTPKVEKNLPPVKEAYRASNPISCDLVHTKLEVSFDWTYSRLNGKATLTLKPHFYPTNMCYLNARGMDIKSVKLFELKAAAPVDKTKPKPK